MIGSIIKGECSIKDMDRGYDIPQQQTALDGIVRCYCSAEYACYTGQITHREYEAELARVKSLIAGYMQRAGRPNRAEINRCVNDYETPKDERRYQFEKTHKERIKATITKWVEEAVGEEKRWLHHTPRPKRDRGNGRYRFRDDRRILERGIRSS